MTNDPADMEALIHERALRFATTFKWFANPVIVKSSPARSEIVKKFGTPGVVNYREVELHLDWFPGSEALKEMSNEDLESMAEILGGGIDLCITCSATDVISYEILRWDLG